MLSREISKEFRQMQSAIPGIGVPVMYETSPGWALSGPVPQSL